MKIFNLMVIFVSFIISYNSFAQEKIENWTNEKVKFQENDHFSWKLKSISMKNEQNITSLPQKGSIVLWKGMECFVYPELKPIDHEKYKDKNLVFKMLKCKKSKKSGEVSTSYLFSMCDTKSKAKEIIFSMGKPNTPKSVFIECN